MEPYWQSNIELMTFPQRPNGIVPEKLALRKVAAAQHAADYCREIPLSPAKCPRSPVVGSWKLHLELADCIWNDGLGVWAMEKEEKNA
jgi:hypothetical protein